MSLIIKIIAVISDSMMVPVTVLLLGLFVYSLYLLGGFFSMYLRLLGERKSAVKAVAALECQAEPEFSGIFGTRLREMDLLNWDNMRCEKRIADFELECAKELERSKFLVKVGPMLGLMGTLIPMGPALVALANGDISSMAMNMNLAFTTTVLGIFIGAVGFITSSVKSRWFTEEISGLRYALDLQTEKRNRSL